MLRKLAVIVAASTMVLTSTVAQASSASALSLRHASTDARATTTAQKDSKLVPGSPLFFVLGIIGVAALLELTGVINVFGGDDDADSN